MPDWADERAREIATAWYERKQKWGSPPLRELMGPIAAALRAEREKRVDRGCPCLYTTPCETRGTGCTCVNGASSYGCLNCCTYGSLEQRKQAAVRIIGTMKGKKELWNCVATERARGQKLAEAVRVTLSDLSLLPDAHTLIIRQALAAWQEAVK